MKNETKGSLDSIEPIDSLGWFERVIKIVTHYNIWEILKGLILVSMASALLFFMTNPTRMFDIYEMMKSKQHIELLEQRMKISPEVQNICENLMYDLDADRVMFLELHNGNIGSGGLPFRKASAVYESIRDVHPIAEQYQNTNLSLLPFSNYIYNEQFWGGSVDSLLCIDRSLGYRMKSNMTEHFEAILVEGVSHSLGFIFVSYSEKPEGHDCEKVKRKMEQASKRIALLIEIGNQ